MFTKIAAAVIGFVVFVIAITVIFGSFYTIDQGEVGVVLRNGAIVGTSEPGLHFKTPWIESVVPVETRQVKWTNRAEGSVGMEAYSSDLQPANLIVTVTYSVNPAAAADIYARYGSNFADKIVTPAIYSAVKIVFGKYDAKTAIANRGAMVAAMKESIQSSVATPDIHVDTFQLENVEFSREFTNAVEQRMQQEIQVQQRAQVLQQEIINANIVRTQAQGQADAQVMQAKAAAQQITLQGDAQATAIKARGDALKDNPGLVALTLAEKWNGQLPATMVPGGALPFIDLGNRP